MDVLAQLARNTGYSVRVNHKVSTTVATSYKKSDVELLNFGLDGFNNLVIDVSICCDGTGYSTVNNGHLNGKMHTNQEVQCQLCCCLYGICTCNCVSGWPNSSSRVSSSSICLG